MSHQKTPNGPLSAPKTPLSRWVEECSKPLKDKTAESYHSLMRQLENFLGRKPMLGDMASAEACRQFAQWLQGQVQVSTARTYLTKLYVLLKKAHKAGLSHFNPTAHDELRLPRLPVQDPTFLTIEQVVSLEKAPCPHESTKRAFLFAVHTGLRLSDIETLRWEHIRPHRGRLMVVKEQVKTARVVRVPLNDKALSILHQITNPQPPSAQNLDDRVFHLKSRGTIANDLRAWARSAGLDLRLTFHVSRHTFVTVLLQSDISIYTASRLCGHAKVATTERYAHLTDSIYDDALRSVNHYWSKVQQE